MYIRQQERINLKIRGSKIVIKQTLASATLILSLLLLATSCGPVITSGTANVIVKTPSDGEQIILQYCAVCHNNDGCDNPPPLLVGYPAALVEGMVRNGNGWGMPSFQGSLSEDQIAAVVAFLSGGPSTEMPTGTEIATFYCQKCCVCHGKNREGITGPALTPEALAGIDISVLKDTINNGRPGTDMPGWKGVLTDQHINDLINFILSPVTTVS